MTRPDVLIRGAEVHDGIAAAPQIADVAISGTRIMRIASELPPEAGRVVDARGLALAPGFIDVHTHDDRAVLGGDMSAKLSQGVTTVVTGNCGISLGPVPGHREVPAPLDLIATGPQDLFARFSDYLRAVEDAGPAVNTVSLVGHTTLRLAAMDRLDREATVRECSLMRGLLDQALADGAIGLSTGLFYKPANAASTQEVITVGEPLARYGGLYVTHLRDEADEILSAMEEAFAIGEATGSPLILSHHKVSMKQNFGRTRDTLPIIEERARSQPVGLDVYPYTASSTVLDARRALSVERVLITWSQARPDLAGLSLDEITSRLGCSRAEAVPQLQPAGAIYFTMDEEDVRRVLRFSDAMIGSDGLPHDIRPHPRLWGTFPRVLGHYARDVGLFGLPEAIRRMTSLPAARFGLAGRGIIQDGAQADLVLFDPAAILDRADFDTPTRSAAGIREVYVNGSLALADAVTTGVRAGSVLRNCDLGVKRFQAATG
ncbi:N-acyl-D-amino-acid deacylase family protein [Salipiger profundus]|uniref:N-acyl-D-amino-acid deacylase family protein n=1 Tax=Salipiger profundus TaxID=1229727 RepID=UPI0008E0C5B8|nr:D-aminoacylase [Salipiger profundus]SFD77620.1 N-acyl-D-amino-acid deacylase [Salipiger profundus]